ncbi:MAG: 4Fe-4S binding protein [Nanobdellota archaeon]
MILVHEEFCPQNHKCPVVNACPTGAISQKSWRSPPEVDQSKCIDCGRCTKMCGVFREDDE